MRQLKDGATELFIVDDKLGTPTYTVDFAGNVALLLEKKFIHSGGYIGHIEDVAVHPEFQGHGIGKALIERIQQARRK